MNSAITRHRLERLYEKYNRREFVHPDPVEFLHRYVDLRDREIVALVASALAYGRVGQILKSIGAVLQRMTPTPQAFVQEASLSAMRKTFGDFRHRFATGENLSGMLFSAGEILRLHGSLQACFLTELGRDDASVTPALRAFVNQLVSRGGGSLGHLLPLPERGSACKRLNLFLRWMVRSDDVDPGGWDGVPRSKLIVPVDTHMHRIALRFGLTKRKQANMGTALEITEAFRKISPQDPVKYDFCLTRFGIRRDLKLSDFQ